jgi:hypothetical protein
MRMGSDCTEGPSPGTKAYDTITRDDKFTYGPLYHWFFHAQPDVPELLAHGKERQYISHFFTRLVSKTLSDQRFAC